MNNRIFDFTADDPERLIDEGDPESLFRAAEKLPQWTQRALEIAELALYDWANAALARPRRREGLPELHALIQRLQVIHPAEEQPTALAVEARYQRWNGLAQLIETRVHGLDHHRPEEAERRTHMPELKRALSAADPARGVSSAELLETMKLAKSRLSQLLALAEAAGLAERERRGGQVWVVPAGSWKTAQQVGKARASEVPDRHRVQSEGMSEPGKSKLARAA